MMNKKEVIEKLQSEAINLYSETSGWIKEIELDIAIDIINQLDEPEIPEVPQYVADWYVDHEAGFELHLSYLCINAQRYPERVDRKVLNWYNNLENEPIQTLVKMKLYSYEVGEEKLYTVSLKKSGIGIGVQQQDGSLKEQFTKDELKEHGFDNLDEYEIEEVKE